MKLSLILDLKPRTERLTCVEPDQPIQYAVDLLCKHDTGALAVVNAGTCHLIGILSDRDILRSLCSKAPADLSMLAVRDLMTTDIVKVSPSEEAHHALALMTAHHISHLPVVQGDELVGMVSQRDILRELQHASEAQVHSLSDYLGGTYGLNVF